MHRNDAKDTLPTATKIQEIVINIFQEYIQTLEQRDEKDPSLASYRKTLPVKNQLERFKDCPRSAIDNPKKMIEFLQDEIILFQQFIKDKKIDLTWDNFERPIAETQTVLWVNKSKFDSMARLMMFGSDSSKDTTQTLGPNSPTPEEVESQLEEKNHSHRAKKG